MPTIKTTQVINHFHAFELGDGKPIGALIDDQITKALENCITLTEASVCFEDSEWRLLERRYHDLNNPRVQKVSTK